MKRIEIQRNGAPLTEAGLANTYFLRLRGLIGRDVNALGGLLIRPCGQIHTCIMSCPIDAIYLDKNGVVLQIDAELPKGRFCKAVRGARSVLELPSGSAKKLKIETGEILQTKILNSD